MYDILQDSGLQQYYRLQAAPGASQQLRVVRADRFAYLDDPTMASQVVEFDDGHLARATLRLPQIHCASCVWLLENLARLESAVRTAEVDVLRREVSLSWDRQRLSLRQLVERLAAIGYEPDITLQSATSSRRVVDDPLVRRVGVAGFCFGNIMLFSLPEYLAQAEPLSIGWQQLFAGLNLLLALPVLLYSAHPFLAGAWQALRRRGVTIDVPIALGIVVLFGRSAVDIVADTGPGYMDSFAGLVFFLLLGRLFQRHSFAALDFERDYRSYFPLSVTLRDDGGDRPIAVADLKPGQRIVAHQGELVPADSRLLSAHGRVDFSYVTGESQPVEAERGDTVWAGGRAVGTALELEVLRDVSQGYLTRLWNQEETSRTVGADEQDLAGLSNRVAMLFTLGVIAIAAATGIGWLLQDAGVAAHAVTSVLIIACPCALALSAPFTTGTALNLLARSGLFLRHGSIVERLSQIQSIVFDKTGTLTVTEHSDVRFDGELLTPTQRQVLASVLAQSVHPLSRAVCSWLPSEADGQVTDYDEQPGLGLAGIVDGMRVCAGSRSWLRSNGVAIEGDTDQDTVVYVGIDGRCLGSFSLGNTYRDGIQDMLGALRRRWSLHLLSGDNDSERQRLLPWFGGESGHLHFDQSPAAKLQFIQDLGQQQRVLMVGDGLNDAGALHHSHVGLAVTEDIAAFSPACDGILRADQLQRLPALLRFSRACVHIIAASMILSVAYNVTGLSFAIRGALSPLVSAVLMPLSSVTVIAFTVLATRLAARRFGIGSA